MAYQLRDRKNKAICIDSNSSSSESDSDPDFSRCASGRQFHRNDMMSIGNLSSVHRPGQGSSSSSSQVMAAIETTVKRRPGRPPRNTTRAPVDFGEIPRRVRRRRTRTPHSLSKRTNSSGSSGEKRSSLAWLVDTERLKLNEVLYYRNSASKSSALRGQVTRDGILCDCCRRVVTPSMFLAHAGSRNTAMLYSRIVVARSRFTLLGCQLLAWVGTFVGKKWKLVNEYDSKGNAADASDDACIVCADGGDLICCDECPLTFHQTCLEMKNVPGDKWVCPCCLCRYCGEGGTEEKNVAQCRVCEKSYHLSCSRGGPRTTPSNDDSTKFCGNVCIELNRKLESLKGVKRNMGGGFSWTLLHHNINLTENNPGVAKFYKDIESNTKIALVWFMMSGCFEPIIDRLTKIDVLRSVIFNTSSNFTRIDFKGFYTVVLEKNDEVIAAASLRLRGRELAEMPFVATQWSYRNKGMLRKLMNGIESALACLEVENLVLPSVEDVEDMWINKFGFRHINKTLEKHIALSKMLMFPKATRLMKSIVSNYKQSCDYGKGSQGGVEENGGKTVLPFDLNLEPPPED